MLVRLDLILVGERKLHMLVRFDLILVGERKLVIILYLRDPNARISMELWKENQKRNDKDMTMILHYELFFLFF
jgi:hypothetical protein